MAMQPDIQYVPFYYVDGSTARKVQHQRPKKSAAAPVQKRRRAKRKAIAVDPVAIGGILVAMVLLVMMLAGFVQYNVSKEQTRLMQDYVTSLQLENAQLQKNYDDSIDMDHVQEVADALGMVRAEDAQQIHIDVQIPQEAAEEMTLWESIATFLAGLFA